MYPGSEALPPGIEPETTPSASDLILSYLESLEVDYLFGIPGGAIEPLYDALARRARRNGITSVVARHETGAALMAEGYARNTGRLGVCCATTGPGATNLITGVASAFENRVPLLAITAQTALDSFGQGAFQDSSDIAVNTVGMFAHCTHFNSLISHSNQLEHKLATAVMTAFNCRGPAHLSIPRDLLKSEIESSSLQYELASLLSPRCWLDKPSVQEFIRLLTDRKSVVFVIGGGCEEAAGSILRTAITLNAKIVTTANGKGLINPFHPLYRGVTGFAGHQSATDVLEDPDVDLVVTIGNILGEWGIGPWANQVDQNKLLVHVDALDNNLARTPMARLHVRADLKRQITEAGGPNFGHRAAHRDVVNGRLRRLNEWRSKQRNGHECRAQRSRRNHPSLSCHWTLGMPERW